MTKPLHFWIAAAPQPAVLVARGQVPQPIVVPCLRIRVSKHVRGAELVGPWLLRAAVRIPAEAAVGGGMRDPCAWMGALHARWLSYMGVSGAAVYGDAPVEHWAACAARAPGDVVVGQRKVVAVTEIRRPGETLIVASTLLRPPPWALLCRTLERSWEEIPVLTAAATSASTLLRCTVDEQRWAASLRSMLHLSLTLPQLRPSGGEGRSRGEGEGRTEGGEAADAGLNQACKAR